MVVLGNLCKRHLHPDLGYKPPWQLTGPSGSAVSFLGNGPGSCPHYAVLWDSDPFNQRLLGQALRLWERGQSRALS